MRIRGAFETDLPAIIEIYNASILGRMATADTEPITLESRVQWFAEHPSDFRPLWVMETDAKIIVGWLSFQSFYGRPAYKRTAEISVYVSPLYQRQGIGEQLLTEAIARSPDLGINRLLGFIFAHNEPSLKLFTKHQFQQWGYLPRVALLDGIERDLVIVGKSLNFD